MKKQYLHLVAYACHKCDGPVVSAALAIRENEISKETDIRQLGARCLSCGHEQGKAVEFDITARDFPPVEWQGVNLTSAPYLATASAKCLTAPLNKPTKQPGKNVVLGSH